MKNLTTIGRILYALPFAVFGINHFLSIDFYMGMVSSFIPTGPFTIILTGLLMMAASISIITKKFIQLSTLLLAALLFIFIITIHIPALIAGVDSSLVLIELLKDTSLLGGSLFIAGIYHETK